MKKALKRLVLLALCMALTPLGSLAETAYVSLPDLAAQARGGWRQTYESHGRTIAVDVDVSVPEAPACPVLSVRRAPLPDEALTAAYRNTAPSAPEVGLFWGRMGEEDAVTGRGRTHLAEMQPLPGGGVPQAENNPLTYEGAVEVVRGELARLTGGNLDADWSLNWARAYERERHYRTADGEVIWGEPATEMGRYDVEFSQLLRGIPLREGVFYTRYRGAPVAPFAARLGALVTDEAHFTLVLQSVQIEQTLHEDVPLLPFDDMKSRLETMIADGLVRGISGMELCYLCFFDPQNETLNVAVPVWRVTAVHAPDAAREYEGLRVDELGDSVDDRPWEDMYFFAQTGEYLSPEDTARDRRDAPEMVTWEDVQ